MSLISIYDIEFSEGNKINNSEMVQLACIQMEREEGLTGKKPELSNFLLKMYELIQKQDNYRGNKNAVK